MLSKKLQDEINKQINREFYSEYVYLSMTGYFESRDLDGFANFFKVQAQEEHFHAMKFFNFVNTMGGKVKLTSIDAPPASFKNIISAFEDALEQEKGISKNINNLVDIAVKENNHAVIHFLQWYVDEQVEEQDLFNKIISKLKLVKGEGHGILMMDSEFAQRKASQEILEANVRGEY